MESPSSNTWGRSFLSTLGSQRRIHSMGSRATCRPVGAMTVCAFRGAGRTASRAGTKSMKCRQQIFMMGPLPFQIEDGLRLSNLAQQPFPCYPQVFIDAPFGFGQRASARVEVVR